MWDRVQSARRGGPWFVGFTAAFLLTSVAMVVEPFPWLPAPNEVRSLLLGLLGAQAAIAALTLAVALFVLQGVAARPDADERVYREYVHLSRVRWIFPWSVVSVMATGAALLVREAASAGMPVVGNAHGLPNLVLVAALAFVANLGLSGLLFERATSLASPAAWKGLRRRVNERDVSSAVRAFVERHGHISVGEEAGIVESAVPPAPDEGSADEAIRALFDDARRAMDERHTRQFAESITAVQQLLSAAMEDLARGGIEWGPPGPALRSWPPLAELSRGLTPFRDEVIRRGEWEYVHAVEGLDRWLLAESVRHRCGELFGEGIRGYGQSYAIAIRSLSREFREYYRDGVWWALRDAVATSGASPEDIYPYLREAVRQQERLLASALHEQIPGDFRSFRDQFAQLLRFVGQRWRINDRPRPDSADQHQALEADARIALLGLGGRALELAESGQIANPQEYLAVVREEYGDLQRLADDAARALSSNEYLEQFSWLRWQGTATLDYAAQPVDPAFYVLSSGVTHLLEGTTGPLPQLDLHGTAVQVLRWFDANITRLEDHVRPNPDASSEERQARVRSMLQAAVQRDEVAEENAIIARPLSQERIDSFVAEVYASRFASDAIERVFAQAGAHLYLENDVPGAPEARGKRELVPKAPFADTPEDAQVAYAEVDGSQWGELLVRDMSGQLCEALDDSPPLNEASASPRDLLHALDDALAELEPSGAVLVLLVGGWVEVLTQINRSARSELQPGWDVDDAKLVDPGVDAWYRGHPIVWLGQAAQNRRMYVVDPATWGCLIRAQTETGRDLIADVDAVTADQARAMLASNPDYFPDEPGEETKLRKLQASVVVSVAERVRFHVVDCKRARRAMVEG